MNRMYYFAVAVFAIIISACTNPSFEDRAKEHLREMAEIQANDPSALVIQDVKTVFSNDSVCFLQYTAKDKNEFGNFVKLVYEYYYVSGRLFSIKEPLAEYYGAYCIDDGSGKGEMSAKECVEYELEKYGNEDSSDLYHFVAISHAISDNRKVPN